MAQQCFVRGKWPLKRLRVKRLFFSYYYSGGILMIQKIIDAHGS